MKIHPPCLHTNITVVLAPVMVSNHSILSEKLISLSPVAALPARAPPFSAEIHQTRIGTHTHITSEPRDWRLVMHRQEITNTIEREMKVQHATARAIACRPTGQQSRCVEPKPRSIAPSLRTSISGATSEKANDVAFTFNLPSGRWSPSPFANHHHFRKKNRKGEKKRLKEKKPGVRIT